MICSLKGMALSLILFNISLYLLGILQIYDNLSHRINRNKNTSMIIATVQFICLTYLIFKSILYCSAFLNIKKERNRNLVSNAAISSLITASFMVLMIIFRYAQMMVKYQN